MGNTMNIEKLERIIIALIFLTISLTFILKPKEEVKEEFIINEDSFEIFPLIAWKSTHEKWDGKEGDIVKVKVIGFDDRGKVKLSMKRVDLETGEDLENVNQDNV